MRMSCFLSFLLLIENIRSCIRDSLRSPFNAVSVQDDLWHTLLKRSSFDGDRNGRTDSGNKIEHSSCLQDEEEFQPNCLDFCWGSSWLGKKNKGCRSYERDHLSSRLLCDAKSAKSIEDILDTRWWSSNSHSSCIIVLSYCCHQVFSSWLCSSCLIMHFMLTSSKCNGKQKLSHLTRNP